MNRPVIDPWPHPACLDDETLLRACMFSTNRTGGPGGQNRNKVETQVILTHTASGVAAQAGERRSQMENKRVALRRLRLALAVEVRVGVPVGEIGSRLWRSRVKAGRIACNPRHADYPALLAEALDVIAASKWDPGHAGLRLECTASQLVKLVKDHVPALATWNRERETRGLHPLK